VNREPQIVVKITPLLGFQKAPLSVYVENAEGLIGMPGSQLAQECDPLLNEVAEELQKLIGENADRFAQFQEKFLEAGI
jgi:hypothetical protein